MVSEGLMILENSNCIIEINIDKTFTVNSLLRLSLTIKSFTTNIKRRHTIYTNIRNLINTLLIKKGL